MGRMANPPHPMWMHLEPFQENAQPTLSSKYPPAQSLFLALGWKLFGHPWYGVWLSCGLMCAALCWMLQGWLPPRYALLGGLMAVAQWGIAGYWVNSYWGGAVAATRGALVVGAVPRLAPAAHSGRGGAGGARRYGAGEQPSLRRAPPRWRPPWRALLVWRRLAPARLASCWRGGWPPPAVAILGCGLAAMLYYDYRVTGNPLLMPYALNQRTYGVAPVFWMMALPPAPAYHHEVIRQFWNGYEVADLRPGARRVPLRGSRVFAAHHLVLLPDDGVRFWRWLRGPVRGAAGRCGSRWRFSRLRRGRCYWKNIRTPHYFAPALGLMLIAGAVGCTVCMRVKAGCAVWRLSLCFFSEPRRCMHGSSTADEYPHRAFHRSTAWARFIA